jgi:hypothetical protein
MPMIINLARLLPAAILLFTNVAAGLVVAQEPTTTDTSVLQQQVTFASSQVKNSISFFYASTFRQGMNWQTSKFKRRTRK